jgi:hypothetical protein
VDRRLKHPHWRLNHERGRGLITLTRSREPFSSIAELQASVAEVSVVLDAVGRSTFALLVDLRDGPMRTDVAFEQAMADVRPKLLRGVPKIAVLVATPLGAMQVSRHQRCGDIEWMTFNDEVAALAYLGIRKAAGG